MVSVSTLIADSTTYIQSLVLALLSNGDMVEVGERETTLCDVFGGCWKMIGVDHSRWQRAHVALLILSMLVRIQYCWTIC